jgi:hypothetical protein
MNEAVDLHPQSSVAESSPAIALGFTGIITRVEAAGDCWLTLAGDAQSARAYTAVGLLVRPQVDDRVLLVQTPQGLVITQVLLRAGSGPIHISSSRVLECIAPILRFKATEDIELVAARRLTFSGCDLVLGAARTLVQRAEHLLQMAGDFTLTARGLLRTSGGQQVMSAQEDVRIDGKRINMG